MTRRKKLIEVALPLEAINKESAREKSIRHGHPSTLHLWWARRPLAACRAVLFAQLVDDPDSDPQFSDDAELAGAKRAELFNLIEELVKWENSNNPSVINRARAEIARCVASRKIETGELKKDDVIAAHPSQERDDSQATAYDLVLRRAKPEVVNHFLATHAPPVLDPFAGGGSIPLEAQRLGLRAHASDLNPVPVLINKALIEIPPKFAGMPPVNTGSDAQDKLKSATYRGAQGLAEDVRYYGQWMRDEAEKRIGHLYPKVKITKEMVTSGDRPDLKPYEGQELTVIAWLWARTVKCQNPACGCRMPMLRSFWLSTKKGKQAWADPILDRQAGTVRFAIRHTGTPPEETSNRTMARCLFCNDTMKKGELRKTASEHGMAEIPLAIVAEGTRGRVYLESSYAEVPQMEKPDAPEIRQLITDDKRWFSPPQYGLPTFHDLFTARQLAALTTFSDLVMEARERVLADAQAAFSATSAPQQRDNTRSDEENARAHGENARARGGNARARGGNARLGGENARARGENARAQEGNARAQEGNARSDGENARAQGGNARSDEGNARARGENARAQGGNARSDEGNARAHGENARAQGGNARLEGENARGSGDVTRLHAAHTPRPPALGSHATASENAANPSPEDYADAVATYLAFGVSRQANRLSTISFWDQTREGVQQAFGRQALPMTWDFAEANPLSDSSGSWLGQISYPAKCLESAMADASAFVQQIDSTVSAAYSGEIISTDPPYYDNIGYSDLSDFFYVWLRRTLKDVYPQLLSTMLTPKNEEMIASPYRHGGSKAKAAAFFEEGLGSAIGQWRKHGCPDYPTTIFYAFKQAETTTAGTSSTGWETFLTGVIDHGFAITGTWPMRTELTGNLKKQVAALASSVVLACVPREADASMATRREFLNALKRELPGAMKKLQSGNIAPVDLAQAAIGPGMAVFSRYSKVVESDGESMTVRTALTLINQILDEVLAEQEGEFDGDTRWAVAWFETHGVAEGPYGTAETLSKAKNTSVQGLVEAGVITARSGKVKLLSRDEMPDGWDPTTDKRATCWEATQHLIRRLQNDGEEAAAALLARLGGDYGERARDLAYRLYSICERKKWADEALAYNGLVIAWPEISRLSRSATGATRSAEAVGLFES